MLIIENTTVGEEYLLVLSKAIRIREERRKIYGDTFTKDTIEFLIAQIENKLKRIKLHLQNKTEINSIEKAEDNALDMINYAIFIAANIKNDK
jgi:hypothetical protein